MWFYITHFRRRKGFEFSVHSAFEIKENKKSAGKLWGRIKIYGKYFFRHRLVVFVFYLFIFLEMRNELISVVLQFTNECRGGRNQKYDEQSEKEFFKELNPFLTTYSAQIIKKKARKKIAAI